MKQKYTLLRNNDTKQLLIKEFGELDKDIMSLLCEETFDEDVITAAIEKDESALIAALRSDNLYPPETHAKKIAESVVALYASEEEQTVDILLDDKELLSKEQEDAEPLEDLKEDVDPDTVDETDELDNLLEDNDIKTKAATSTIKIADDDLGDAEDES